MNATPTADTTASLGHLAGSIVGPGDPIAAGMLHPAPPPETERNCDE